jgi:hypothetical protein
MSVNTTWKNRQVSESSGRYASLRHHAAESLEASVEGVHALLVAILTDAMMCLAGKTGSGAERNILAGKARAWIARRDRRWPFSFENVCIQLDLDPATVRARLLGTPAPAKRRKRTKR